MCVFLLLPQIKNGTCSIVSVQDIVLYLIVLLLFMQNSILGKMERAGIQKTPSENHRKELKF